LNASIGDWIAGVAVALSAIGYFSREFRQWRTDGTARATTDATVKVQIEGFEKAMNSMVESYKSLDKRQDNHELECAEFRGAMREVMKSNAQTQETMARTLENINAKVNRLMPGGDMFLQVIGPTNQREPPKT
jgi:hypothetical protein